MGWSWCIRLDPIYEMLAEAYKLANILDSTDDIVGDICRCSFWIISDNESHIVRFWL
jgi:hypothetical protein